MNTNLSKQEMISLVFTDKVKTNLKSFLSEKYKVTQVNYKPLDYGLGIEIIGSNSFTFIKNSLAKISGVSIDTIAVLKEDENNLLAYYAYMPEKDKNLQKKFKSKNIH